MGIKGLWTFLAPYCEKKPLQQIKGEVLAVDLSGWVCDSQNVADSYAQPKLYLRNLFFRTSYLLLSEITPVFVLEGEAPAMKQDIMANRNLIQSRMHHRGNKPSKAKKPDTKRKRFASVLTQCENLLKSMGVQCIQGKGEAEAMCAYLNAIGMVDAVISQDSDCFGYGAIRVYRNFSVSSSGCSSANSGSVDIYDMVKICKTVDFGRNKVIAMALLCGSDYNGGGVEGVGYSSSVSLLMQFKDSDILDRLKSWSNNPRKFEKLADSLHNSNNTCADCGHSGNYRNHQRLGCKVCQTSSGCSKSHKEKTQSIKNELSIRSKAISMSSNFPDDGLMEEFLGQTHDVPSDFSVDWKRPDLIKFIKIMTKALTWTESYCIEKFLPLLTKWQLISVIKSKSTKSKMPKNLIRPDRIKKKRTPKGIPSYEVVWKDPESLYSDIISDDQIEDEESHEKLWTTIERQDLMEEAYPNVVNAYTNTLKKKGKTQPKKNKPENKITNYIKLDDEIEILNTSLQSMHVDKPKPKTKRKRQNLEASFNTSIKRKRPKGKLNKSGLVQKKLDAFIPNIPKLPISTNEHLLDTSSNISYIFPDNITFNSDFNDSELSCIVQNMISNKHETQQDLQCYNSTPNKVPFFFEASPKSPIVKSKKRISHFFGHLTEDVDEFEKSLDLKNKSENSDASSDCSDNLKENFNPNNLSTVLTPIRSKSQVIKESPTYTPLSERIKKYNLLKK